MLWRAPSLLVNQDLLRDHRLGPEHRLIAEHNARLIVISIGGALVVVTGLLYTARNYRLAHRGQVTERFTKALERLGSDELYVRIGGVHALEHVMRDSPEHHGDVVEVLVAFVRGRAPRRRDEPVDQRQWMHPPIGTDTPKLSREPAADVQAALTALAQRPKRANQERGELDFHDLHLFGVNLHDADLRDANLQGAVLVGANLRCADLRGAVFWDAELHLANLDDARLQNAWLSRAGLQGASLEGAQLQGATLRNAELQGAVLRGAQLQNAVLEHALLQSACLDGAQLQEALLDGAQLQGARLESVQLQGASLSGAQLQGANLRNTTLTAEQLGSVDIDQRTLLSHRRVDTADS
ncbi:pentapeptide repeat-containing protein [Lentzea tibetensis]|uniref:Pentapeptide repeat-containing protein n=1 Tax=Lentzea tibetensis TaxID=2591470 RepID=A0A563EKB0_9PSEU|nr:pentapeptide repeat-containing protein [Lentzea tibetensis]